MYRAILFAPDGDYVTDFPRKTESEVISELENMGSKWFFYPFYGIIKTTNGVSKLKRVDMMYPLGELSGKTIVNIQRWFAENQEEIEMILSE